MGSKICGKYVAFFVALSVTAGAYAAPTGTRPAGYNDSGAQLNRTRRYLEEQAVLHRIEEGRHTQQVQTTDQGSEQQAEELHFTISQVVFSPSEVLSAEALQQLATPYQREDVSLQDLYRLVSEVNTLYAEQGYVTCRAYLPPQTIHDGMVEIRLVEGKNGNVKVMGDDTTRQTYITHRLAIKEGQIQKLPELNKRLLRFNAMNDAQLRVMMKAGEKEGTTDYVIAVKEPQQQSIGVYADNAGSKTSGEYRIGTYWQNRSLFGNWDMLFLNALRSEGTKAVSAAYSTPINRSGTKLGATYSTNSVHITDGPLEPLSVKGHSYAYTLSLTQPIETTEKLKSQWMLEYGGQNSKTDFGGGYHWIDDQIQTGQVAYDQINYGTSSIFYQKHGYRFGSHENIYGDDRTFGKYIWNLLYQKIYRHGQNLNIKFDGQWAQRDYLPSAEMYYVGGLYSVRGYKDSVIGGDSGLTFNAEYSLPLDTKRNWNAYTFLDTGHVWGASAFDDNTIVGTGLGVRVNIGKKSMLNLGWGIPLIRDLNGEDQKSSRLHFSYNGQF